MIGSMHTPGFATESRHRAMPRILILNGNTTEAVTGLVTRHVRAELPGRFELKPATARFGARYISTEASYAIAGHAALDCLAEQGADCDSILLACFGDPGLFALRELSAAPVVGLAEAAMEEAAAYGRFSIVTGGVLWKPMLERLAFALGRSAALASIRPITLTGDQIAADPDSALRFLAAEARAAQEQDGAQAVILGGAALAGIAARLAPELPLPLIDSVLAGARVAAARADAHAACASQEASNAHRQVGRSGRAASRSGPSRIAPSRVVPSIGLSPALERLLR